MALSIVAPLVVSHDRSCAGPGLNVGIFELFCSVGKTLSAALVAVLSGEPGCGVVARTVEGDLGEDESGRRKGEARLLFEKERGR